MNGVVYDANAPSEQASSKAWPGAAVTRLTELWNKGLSAGNIAETMNGEGYGPYTRNAIIGKATRIGLEGRESPIKPGTGKPRKRGRNLKALDVQPVFADPDPEPVATPTPPQSQQQRPLPKTCLWPLGDPREADFHYCDDPKVMPGKPYCEPHCAIAYRQPKGPNDVGG